MSELYDLPDGWSWNLISESFKIKSGDFLSKKNMIESGDINVYGGNGINGKHNQSNLNGENIIIGRVGAQCGNVRLVNDSIWITDNAFYISEYKKEIDKQYLTYLLSFMDLGKTANQAAQPVISFKSISSLYLPFPSLSEQQRIVSKLDNLFEKIDKAIELHQKNIYEANVFMGSVLNDVFGELEEKYPKIKFDEVCNKITDGSHNPPKGIETSEFLMLSSKNIFNNSINFDNPRYLKEEDFIKENKRTDINKGDVLLTIVGTIGRTAVVNLERKFVLQRSVAVLKPKKNLLDSYFLMYSLQKNLDILMSGAKGAAQKGIYLKSIKNLEIVNLPLNIQQEVVKYLNEVSQKIEKVKSIQKEKMENLKALKASILDKAFKGKL